MRTDTVFRYTADDEFPNCCNCDLFDRCDPDKCGPEHGLANYYRTERGVIDAKFTR